MKKIILIIAAIAALAGAFFWGKHSGKSCCKDEGKVNGLASDGFKDGPQSRIRILNVFAFQDTNLDITNYKYVYKIDNGPVEVLPIYVEGNRRYSAVFQSFRKKGGGLNSERPKNDGDYEIDDNKQYQSTFIIIQIDKKNGDSTEIFKTSHEKQYTGKTLKDAESNLFYQFIPVRKKDKSAVTSRDGDIKPLQNPPINPIGPAPGPG